jgi:hypothetical protein
LRLSIRWDLIFRGGVLLTFRAIEAFSAGKAKGVPTDGIDDVLPTGQFVLGDDVSYRIDPKMTQMELAAGIWELSETIELSAESGFLLWFSICSFHFFWYSNTELNRLANDLYFLNMNIN